jgi:hypothetical protein
MALHQILYSWFVATLLCPRCRNLLQRTARKRRTSPERPSIHRRDAENAENAEKKAASTMTPLHTLRLRGEYLI